MTSDPLRRPDEPASDPVAGAPAPADPPPASEPTPTTPGPPTTPEPPGEADTLSPAAAASAEAAAAMEAVPQTEAVTTAEAVAAAEAAAAESAPAEKPRRRTAVVGAMRHLAIVVLGLALFVGGVALGNYAFQTSRNPSAAVGVGDAPLGEPANVTKEFISALAANDADALRSSLMKEPHIDLTREMERYGIQSVDKVEILGTQVDGTRSATEILMEYQRTDGVAFAINLVVLVEGSQIEGFR
jgi:hypothetical protein